MKTKTFIRAIEVWVLDHTGGKLELGSAYYGDMLSFKAVSEVTKFNYGEGLPGKAWAQKRPIILKQLTENHFKRAEAGEEWGLTCGIALPIFIGDFIKAVVVLLCGDDEEHVGAVEIWHNEITVDYGLDLLDGYYGAAELFEWQSSHTSFRKGIGLPGKVWAENKPLFFPNLVNRGRFLRSNGALKVGINRGLGFPFVCDGHTYVVTLLCALGTPIARRYEIWAPLANDKTRLIFEDGHCDIVPDLSHSYAEQTISLGQGIIGKVAISGIPVISQFETQKLSIADVSAKQAGLTTGVVIPIINDGKLNRIVCWYF